MWHNTDDSFKEACERVLGERPKDGYDFGPLEHDGPTPEEKLAEHFKQLEESNRRAEERRAENSHLPAAELARKILER